jgi:hypothetical protein
VSTPTRQDRLRPLELVGMAAIVAVFIGLVVLGSTRQLILALVFLGVAFIVSLVVIAMLSLAVKPDDAERSDLAEQDDSAAPGGSPAAGEDVPPAPPLSH